MIVYPNHALREFNDCHEPGGRSVGGQFCSDSDGVDVDKASALADTIGQEALKVAGFPNEPITGADVYAAAKLKQHVEDMLTATLARHPDVRKVAEFLAKDEDLQTDEGNSAHRSVEGLVGDARGPKDYAAVLAHVLIKQWARSTNPSDPVALAIQLAAHDAFKLEGAADAHLVGDDRVYRTSPSLFQAALQVQYDATQAWFKARGVTEVTVYRGMRSPGKLADGVTPVQIKLQPLSSFSADAEIATYFAEFRRLSSGYASATPVLLATKIPVERILSTPNTGFGSLREREVTVLGGTLQASAYSTRDRFMPAPFIAALRKGAKT